MDDPAQPRAHGPSRVAFAHGGADGSVVGQNCQVGPDAPRILTPDQRPRVFVSSTLQELADERAAARAAIDALRLIPVMFEMGARPHPARALYRAYLAQSHVFVGIYFARYGWVAPGEDVSGLEDEYQLSGELPRLVYVKAPAPDREPRLGELLSRIRDEDTVAYKAFGSRDELQQLLREDLAVLLAERFLLPPAAVEAVAGVQPVAVPQTTPGAFASEQSARAGSGDLRRGGFVHLGCPPRYSGRSWRDRQDPCRLGGGASTGRTSPVSFVSLDAVDEPTAVLPEVAASIGLGLDSGLSALDALTAAFADRPFLLVVDNFEQVQAAAPDFAKLLVACPKVSVLARSRIPLKVRGERLVPLGPLELPAGDDRIASEQSAAVRLFVDRARAVRPAFSLEDPGDRDAVVQLCRRLDGIPLALELAAGRSALLAPRALLDRIGTALDLSAGASDLPGRQRTLRDTLAWSLHLLAPRAECAAGPAVGVRGSLDSLGCRGGR